MHINIYSRKNLLRLFSPIFTLFLVMITSAVSWAQSTITGTVTGTNNSPVFGATVLVKGTSRGTSTDNAGKFTISAAPTETLVITSVGYTSQEINIAGRSTVDISMVATAGELEQVVVIGYGTARRKDLTGSVASINGRELAKQPVLTATQAVQGKVAGVQVITSGDPNALPVIRIRGTGTMLAGVNPLYVVDGVINDDIRNINTSDIVSMEVLKDASATAIYGSRGANGVVLITTKRGKSGSGTVAFDMYYGEQEISINFRC